ncbi:methyl-accepting chemotaxis protein [Herbaspirillum huttiense]|uniref:methyl-accepting chemotaxis protein n=1 Tax=Herbaspirillum huttiense TaxID=863372 RepID=UPI0039AFD34A
MMDILIPSTSQPSHHWKNRLSIQTTLTILAIGSFFAIILATYAVIHFFVAPDLSHLERDIVISQVDSISSIIREQLQRVETQSRGISQAAATSSPETMDAFLPALIDQFGDPNVIGGGIWPLPGKREAGKERFSTFYVREPSKGALKKNDYWNTESSPRYWEQPWFANGVRAPKGRCIWAAAYNNAASAVPKTNCDMPLYKGDSLYGVVTINVTLDLFNQVVADVEQRIHGQVMIIESDGKMVSSNSQIDASALLKNVSELAEKSPMAAKVAELLQHPDEQQAGGSYIADGVPQSVFVKKIEGTPWLIAASVPTSSLTKNTTRILTKLSSVQIPMAVLLMVLVILGIRAMMSRLNTLRSKIHELSSGEADLTRRVPETGGKEFAAIAASLNTFIRRLGGIVQQVVDGTQSVSDSSQQISSGNIDLSARTEEQASALEETAASMLQLTEVVRNNADNAMHAKDLATQANTMALAGNQAMLAMLSTMTEINSGSERIGNITRVIEDIAFQTNLLALNAAVEAARAGDQGRGFAVVASEVRVLAQRSASAAKEIKSLIDLSVTTTQGGARQALEVGSTIDLVQQSISQVSDIISAIAAASDEQSRGINEINQAVCQLDATTQQNAELVAQAATAAQSLDEQATCLKAAVSVFKL